MAVDISKYMVDLRGRKFVTYEGLLALAHDKGLQTISTELRQIPSDENGHVAIVHALVILQDERRFAGLGDAGPQNTSRMISVHSIRMAETRAKARALRDAVNVGITSLEELGPDEDSAPAPVTPLREAQQRTSQAKEHFKQGMPLEEGQGRKLGEQQQAEDRPATRKQLNYLEALIADAVEDGVARFEEMAGKYLGELTAREASDWIGRLSGKTG